MIEGNRLPPAAQMQIESAIENWNRLYGTKVQATGWSLAGRIASRSERAKVVAEALSPENAWLPSGDIGKPAEMVAVRVGDDLDSRSEVIDMWRRDIAVRFEEARYVFKIVWAFNGREFETIGVAREDQILYDSMLSNACLSAEIPTGTATGNPTRRCLDMKMGWIWQKDRTTWQRGEIFVDMAFECQLDLRRRNQLVSCDGTSGARLTLGTAEANCRAASDRNRCKLEWSWRWATGLKRIKVGVDGFSLEVEGILGQSAGANGSATAICT